MVKKSNEIKISAANVIAEIDKLYNATSFEMLKEDLGLLFNKNTITSYRVAIANETGPCLPAQLNYMGIPIFEYPMPEDYMVLATEKFCRELIEAHEYFNS